MNTWFAIIVAVVLGWMLQMYMTYQQAKIFNSTVRTLRTSGLVSVGAGGRRYRGGRAIVAVAVDTTGTVRDSLCLSGWTTLARGKPLPELVGASVDAVAGEYPFLALSKPQREAARQAVTLMGQKWQAPMS